MVIEHRVKGFPQTVGTSTPAAPTPTIGEQIRHLILIDFGSIDEPALPLHSLLK